MILNETYSLPNGVAIPKLGLGTWRIDDDKVADAIRAAAALGYRHFDTAQGYGNERGVGEGERIRDVAVARDGAVWLIEDASPGRLLRLTPTR